MAAQKDPDPRIDIHREIGRKGSFHDYMQLAWKEVEPETPFFDGWDIGAMCEHLQAVTEGEIDKLIINIPPGRTKSRTTGVFWPTWVWQRDAAPVAATAKPKSLADTRFGYFSFDADLTLQSASDSLDLMKSDWYQARWGDKFKFKERDPAAGRYFNNRGGMRFASSVDGKATGRHFHVQVIDDPLKPKALSAVTLSAARLWLSGTMASRWCHPTRRARVIVMQRLHEDDTTAVALAEGGYVHLKLPLEFDSHKACSTLIGFKDPRTKDGELLCPDFMTPKNVASLKHTMTLQDYTAQYQQEPVPAGGNIFKDEWIKFWVQPGASTAHVEQEMVQKIDGTYYKRQWVALPKKMSLLWQSWDFTFKDTKTSDYVVGQVWGRAGADYFLLDRFRGRADFVRSLVEIKIMSDKWPKARAKLVEDKANGTAIMNALKPKVHGLIAVEPDGGKEARAFAVAPLHAAGNVYYPDPSQPGFEWVREHMSEMLGFPYAKYDDTVDCETQALNWGSVGFKTFAAAMERIQGNSPAANNMRNLLAGFGR